MMTTQLECEVRKSVGPHGAALEGTTMMIATFTDRWGEQQTLPSDHIRPDHEGVFMVRVWCWRGTSWCRGHRCPCPGWEWVPDTEEARREHPEGKVGWEYPDRAFGSAVDH